MTLSILSESKTKTCTKCGFNKSLEMFSRDNRKHDGLKYWCKPCCKTVKILWKTANKASLIVSIKEYNVAYYIANAEKIKAYQAAQYAANPAKCLAAVAASSAAHPEQSRIQSQNRRARKLEVGGKLSIGIAAKLFKLQRGKCACCGLPLGDDYHRDHIMPLALGGSNTDVNIQLLRRRCNFQKNAKHPVDFMQQRGFLL